MLKTEVKIKLIKKFGVKKPLFFWLTTGLWFCRWGGERGWGSCFKSFPIETQNILFYMERKKKSSFFLSKVLNENEGHFASDLKHNPHLHTSPFYHTSILHLLLIIINNNILHNIYNNNNILII